MADGVNGAAARECETGQGILGFMSVHWMGDPAFVR